MILSLPDMNFSFLFQNIMQTMFMLKIVNFLSYYLSLSTEIVRIDFLSHSPFAVISDLAHLGVALSKMVSFINELTP